MPKIIVLDTHIWFWLMTQEFERFPVDWQDEINEAARVGVSPVSCYEIALANHKGRLELLCAVDRWFEAALEPAGIELLPLTAAVACRAITLSAHHRNPFDRMIIASFRVSSKASKCGWRICSVW